jgi:hypothetical protein
MKQSPLEKSKIRLYFTQTTEKLKKSGTLPSNYPNHRESKPYELLRSELNLYKETHGRDFVLPKGSVIIEDIQS